MIFTYHVKQPASSLQAMNQNRNSEVDSNLGDRIWNANLSVEVLKKCIANKCPRAFKLGFTTLEYHKGVVFINLFF